jgi:hypothetical protein
VNAPSAAMVAEGKGLFNYVRGKCRRVGSRPKDRCSRPTGLARVRRNLLRGLARGGLIAAPTLAVFKDDSFLFDHAIRCRLSKADTKKEWRRAKRFNSHRAHAAHHLDHALGLTNGPPALAERRPSGGMASAGPARLQAYLAPRRGITL